MFRLKPIKLRKLSIYVLLLHFGILHQYTIQDNTGRLFLHSYNLLKGLCGIVHFLLNSVIIVTSFVWVQY